jgi:hypothetical protein
MTPRILIPYSDLVALGGRQEGDPPPMIECASVLVGKEREPARSLVLPESGALACRVLWRHLGGRALWPFEVPRLLPIMDEQHGDRWALEAGGAWLPFGHGDILDQVEALRAIIRDEAEKARKVQP